MRKPQGPCQGCADRRTGDPETGEKNCHADCRKYKAFKEQLQTYKQLTQREKMTSMITKKRPWLDPQKLAEAKRREKNNGNK